MSSLQVLFGGGTLVLWDTIPLLLLLFPPSSFLSRPVVMRLHTGSLDIPCSGMNHYFARVPSHAPDILLYKQESIIIIIMVRTI